MATAKIFQSDTDKAIFILPDDLIYPAQQTVGIFPDDFMEDRNQPMLNIKSPSVKEFSRVSGIKLQDWTGDEN